MSGTSSKTPDPEMVFYDHISNTPYYYVYGRESVLTDSLSLMIDKRNDAEESEILYVDMEIEPGDYFLQYGKLDEQASYSYGQEIRD
ncbi:hypothetical protein [Litchfieldia alkalitelluris]|uniref:hypothetical protein n=1 Tax=Litchfieldia alkalitelluris TaxID=304268 RepID=UPI000997A7F2|nr:hypothetical protein [Litchfieldia alkalitelluris]